jgi:hypothetical protein
LFLASKGESPAALYLDLAVARLFIVDLNKFDLGICEFPPGIVDTPLLD